jgi:hypothetical protein
MRSGGSDSDASEDAALGTLRMSVYRRRLLEVPTDKEDGGSKLPGKVAPDIPVYTVSYSKTVSFLRFCVLEENSSQSEVASPVYEVT